MSSLEDSNSCTQVTAGHEAHVEIQIFRVRTASFTWKRCGIHPNASAASAFRSSMPRLQLPAHRTCFCVATGTSTILSMQELQRLHRHRRGSTEFDHSVCVAWRFVVTQPSDRHQCSSIAWSHDEGVSRHKHPGLHRHHRVDLELDEQMNASRCVGSSKPTPVCTKTMLSGLKNCSCSGAVQPARREATHLPPPHRRRLGGPDQRNALDPVPPATGASGSQSCQFPSPKNPGISAGTDDTRPSVPTADTSTSSTKSVTRRPGRR